MSVNGKMLESNVLTLKKFIVNSTYDWQEIKRMLYIFCFAVKCIHFFFLFDKKVDICNFNFLLRLAPWCIKWTLHLRLGLFISSPAVLLGFLGYNHYCPTSFKCDTTNIIQYIFCLSKVWSILHHRLLE